MFSGIIEGMATVVAIEKEQENVNFTLRCPFGKELKPAQSLAHNGVCLTIVTVEGDTYTTTAMRETLERSNLGDLKVGDEVIITGPTTGAVPLTINEIRVDLKPVEKTVKGERFSIRVDEKIRPSDKLFIWQPVQPKAHIPIE